MITLGQLIEKLEAEPQDNSIQFDFCGLYIGEICVLNSFFTQEIHDLMFTCRMEQGEIVTVGDLLKQCNSLVGSSFTSLSHKTAIIDKNFGIHITRDKENLGTSINDVITEKAPYTEELTTYTYLTTSRLIW